MEERTYYVYRHLFPNGKNYIGLTCQDLQARWGCNGSGYKHQKKIYDAIKKYGWENVFHDVYASDLTASEAQDLEKWLIHKYNSIENGYNTDDGGGLGGNPWVEIELDGKMYSSHELAEMSSGDITYHDITTRVRHHGWDLDRAMHQPKMRKNILYEYKGGWYTCSEIYEKFDCVVSKKNLKSRLTHGWDIERALTQPDNIKVQPFGVGDRIYEYNGRMYNSYELAQLSPIEGIKSHHITDRINNKGWSVERAINTPLKSHNALYEYEGKKYTSSELAKIASDPNIENHDITDRLRDGWTVKEAVEIPKGVGKKRYYKTLCQLEAKHAESSKSMHEGSETNG